MQNESSSVVYVRNTNEFVPCDRAVNEVDPFETEDV